MSDFRAATAIYLGPHSVTAVYIGGNQIWPTSGSIDTASPVVTVVEPAAGAIVAGSVLISGTVTDNVSVSSVIVRVNGITVGTAAIVGTSWSYIWTTTNNDVGSRGITATATDTSNNTSTSAVRTVTVEPTSGLFRPYPTVYTPGYGDEES